ncbi:hypothetical protein ACE01U_04615 [Acinetobacter sp. BSP-153]|uniref:hypothetical protein n=1 Tax=unclassified Acinetobacter TaxID=196816 RepID=UPI001D185009|nr:MULTISPECIES: hypothetical protein [unclassified Acinetobacter]
MKIQILSALFLAMLVAGCQSNPSNMVEAESDLTSVVTSTVGNEVSASKSAENKALEQAVHAYTQDQSNYQTNTFDLNQDGLADAVVLLDGSEWCGSGGCTLLVFKGLANGRFQPHSKMTVSSTPIYALSTQTQGWHDLSVYTRGLGQVILKFNGKSYPSNPSLATKYTANLKQVSNTLLLPIVVE